MKKIDDLPEPIRQRILQDLTIEMVLEALASKASIREPITPDTVLLSFKFALTETQTINFNLLDCLEILQIKLNEKDQKIEELKNIIKGRNSYKV